MKNWCVKFKFFFVAMCLGLSCQYGFSQASTANYNFSSTATGSLTDMSSATTTLIGPNTDGLNMGTFSIVNDIGFTFYFMGMPYTTFVATEDGVIRLGNSLTSINRVPDIVANEPRIIPFSCDMRVGNNGKVHYKIIGTAPNRVFVVEWLNMIMSYPETSSNIDGNSTFQLRLYENSSNIEFVYGYIEVVTHRTGQEDFGAIGFATSNVDNSFIVKTSSFTNSTVSRSIPIGTILPDLITTTGEVSTGLSSYADEQRRIYTFSPKNPAPSAPLNLIFTDVSQTSITLNWTDNSTVETAYHVYRSDDGGLTYQLLLITNANVTTSGPISGLPSKTYYWRVYAVNEGFISSPLEGARATLPAMEVYSVVSGDWNSGSSWNTGTVPTNTDNVTISDGNTIRINTTNAVCNNLIVGGGSSGILRFIGGTTSATLTVDGDITVNQNATFTIINNATGGTRKLILGNRKYSNSNLTVNGIFNMNRADQSFADVEFRGERNGSISGTGATCNFYSITVNKGTNIDAIIELSRQITMNTPATAGSRLNITNGTFKISIGVSLTPYYGDITLCNSTGKICINHADAVLQTAGYGLSAGPGNVTVNGILQILSGTVNFGSGNNTATVNGTLRVEGPMAKFNIAGAASFPNGSYFIMNNGELNLDPQAGNNLSTGNVLSFGDQAYVNFTGGTLTFIDPKNFIGTYDFFIPTAGEINKNFAGSVVCFGNGSSSASGTSEGFTLRAPDRYQLSLGSIQVNNPSGSNRHVRIQRIDAVNNLIIQNLNIVVGEFQISGIPLQISGNISNSGQINASLTADRLVMKGASAQTIGAGTIISPTNNLILEIDNAAGVTLNSPMTIKTLVLTKGKLNTTVVNILAIQQGGSAGLGNSTSYVKGPLKITIPASTTADYSFPVGYGSYNLLELTTCRTNAGGTVEMLAEVTDADCGGSYSFGTPPDDYYLNRNHYWKVSFSAGQANFTDTYVRITEVTQTSGQYLTRSLTADGTYSNISILPDGATGNTIVSSSALTQTGGVIGYFCTASNFMSGTYTVGPGGTFTSLTGPTNSLFAAINSRGMRGDITAQIIGDISEEGSTTLNQWNEAGGSNWTLTIQPDGTTKRVLSGVQRIVSLFRINGAKNVVFDGVNKYLVLRNTRTSAGQTKAVVEIYNGASDITFKNCEIEGNITTNTLAIILLGTGTNRNLHFLNNNIRQSTGGSIGNSANGFYCNNASNSNIEIFGNNIYNWTEKGVFLNLVGDSIEVSENSFYHVNNPNVLNTGIYILGGVGHTIQGNYIGGQDVLCGGSALTCRNSFKGIYVQSTGDLSISNNTISNILLNTTLDFYGIELSNGNARLLNNTVSQISSNGRLLCGIYSNSSKNIAIEGCVVSNFSGTSTTSRLIGLHHDGTGACNIVGNRVSDLTTIYTQTIANYGILNNGVAISGSISENEVYNLSSTSVTTNSTKMVAIGITSVTLPIITKNLVYSISNASTSTSTTDSPIADGILLGTITSGADVINNIIHLGNGQASNIQFSGIHLNTNPVDPANVNIQYNTVVIEGVVTSGSLSSFAFLRGVNSTSPSGNFVVNLQNNIFINNRTGGSGNHFAIGNFGSAPSTGWNANASNFNFLATSNSSIAGLWGSVSSSFINWKSSSNGDSNSLFGAVGGVTNAESFILNNLFNNLAGNNLSINSSNIEAWYVNGKGLPILVNDDFANVARSKYLVNGATDIGAFEVTPTSVPISAIQTGSIADGLTTSYSFGGRTYAQIVWHGSDFPSLDFKYYSGIDPTDDAIHTLSATKVSNAFWRINASGGIVANYNYDITLFYDENILKTIDDESGLNICKNPYIYPLATSDPVNNWRSYPCTRDVVLNTVTATGVFGFSDFALEEGSAPLPVELIYFNAFVETNKVKLTWETASESNNNYFEIQRSIDLRNWEVVNQLPGAGNSQQRLYYSVYDENPFLGTSYYRLVQFDFDGKSSASGIKAVKVTGLEGNKDLLVSFSALRNQIHIRSSFLHPMVGTITIYDVNGNVKYSSVESVESGENYYKVNQSFETGLHLLKLETQKATKLVKIAVY